MSRTPRRGYTIRELLAVMVVLSVLFALIVPGLQSQISRTPAHRTVCRNNLIQLSLAMQNYESTFNCLPPSGHGIEEESLQARLDAGLAPIEKIGTQSIFMYALNFIEGGNIVANYDWSQAYNDPQSPRCRIPGYTSMTWNAYAAKQIVWNFRCTANPYRDIRDPAGYGITDYMPITYTDIDPKPDARGIVGTRNRATTTPGCFSLKGTRLSDITDGTSNTIMIAESAGRLPESIAPFMSGEFADPFCATNAASNDACTKSGRRAFWRWAEPTSAGGISGQRNHGVRGLSIDFVSGNKASRFGGTKSELEAARSTTPPAEGTNSKCLWTWTNCGPNDEIFAWHNGGAQVVFADSSVHTLDTNIDPVVLRGLLSRKESSPATATQPK
jgi:prepilin-type processing-associated H-X9-DG protein